MARQSWDEYFFDLARVVAGRSTCDRLHVGCVLVRDRRVVATGYNGSLPGEVHCSDVGCDVVDGHCVRTVHAELNALLQAARFGVAVEGAWAFVTHEPCHRCEKALRMAGVRVVRFEKEYSSK